AKRTRTGPKIRFAERARCSGMEIVGGAERERTLLHPVGTRRPAMRPESAIFRSSDRRSATSRTMAKDRIAPGQALLVAVSVLAAEPDERDSWLESHHFPPDELAMQLDDAVVHASGMACLTTRQMSSQGFGT